MLLLQAQLNVDRLLDQARNIPRLRARQWTALLNHDDVTLMKLIVFIVGMVFLRKPDDFSVKRMLNFTLDQDRYGLVHLVTDNSSRQ